MSFAVWVDAFLSRFMCLMSISVKDVLLSSQRAGGGGAKLTSLCGESAGTHLPITPGWEPQADTWFTSPAQQDLALLMGTDFLHLNSCTGHLAHHPVSNTCLHSTYIWEVPFSLPKQRAKTHSGISQA